MGQNLKIKKKKIRNWEKKLKEFRERAYLEEANSYPCEQSTGGCWEKGKWYPLEKK